jgi:pyruvate formate lyase activating enzyme
VTEERTPLIVEVKGNSLDDGPGIRTVIFFKGCPLSCVWCHNPECMRPGLELAFDARECVGCNTCLGVCPVRALSRDNPGFVDRDKCNLCLVCADACPSGALARVGRAMSVEEVIAAALTDLPFFRTSGGGVTLSGGEPTMYMDFSSRLLAGLKKENIHTLLETCGQFDHDRFTKELYPHLDLIYYDLKLHDPGEHRRYCGVSNDRILDNFEKLFRAAREGGVPVLPRIPLVPGITDKPRNLAALAGFLAENGAKQVALMPYNPLWVEKGGKVGVNNPHARDESMRTWMSAGELARCRAAFSSFNLGSDPFLHTR